MIINLHGKAGANGEITFNLTPVYFGVNQCVTVNEVFILYSKKLSDVAGVLTSTLIDRSPVNLNQQLLFFYQENKCRSFYYSPTQKSKYKIQNSSLQSSVFNLQLYKADEKKEKISNVEIEKIYLQLEVFPNAGLQHVNKKSL